MMMKAIQSVYDFENGDILFKNTDFDDKGKNFFMRIINEATTLLQNIKRWFKNQPPIVGRDHTEFLLWNGTVLETTSSVKGAGIRSQNFMKWLEREGYPKIEVLRRSERMTVEEVTVTHQQILIDRGIPYATIPAIRDTISDGHSEVHLSTGDLMIRGIYCSESTKRYAGYKPWTGDSPSELYDFLICEGYELVYIGESSDLIR